MSLYVPPHFDEDRLDVLQDAIARIAFGTLVTVNVRGERREIVASHVPMLLERDRGRYGTLRGHIARPNEQWRDADPAIAAVAMFVGPHAYVSPSWYATKGESGKVVPTWNYITVHASGTPAFFDDPQRLHALVSELTDRHEGERDEPWHVSDAPDAYVAGQLKGIVGFEMPIERIVGKWKLSQNRSEDDRRGVIEGMTESLEGR